MLASYAFDQRAAGAYHAAIASDLMSHSQMVAAGIVAPNRAQDAVRVLERIG